MRALARRWLPRRTVRLRLTLLYGALFLVSGAALLAITYVLVARQSPARSSVQAGIKEGRRGPPATVRSGNDARHRWRSPPGAEVPDVLFARGVANETQAQQLRSLLTVSLLALGIMALGSILLGWLMAGRALRPLRTMTAATRQISGRTSTSGSRSTARTTSSRSSATRSTACSRGCRPRSTPSGGSSRTPRTSSARR